MSQQGWPRLVGATVCAVACTQRRQRCNRTPQPPHQPRRQRWRRHCQNQSPHQSQSPLSAETRSSKLVFSLGIAGPGRLVARHAMLSSARILGFFPRSSADPANRTAVAVAVSAHGSTQAAASRVSASKQHLDHEVSGWPKLQLTCSLLKISTSTVHGPQTIPWSLSGHELSSQACACPMRRRQWLPCSRCQRLHAGGRCTGVACSVHAFAIMPEISAATTCARGRVDR